MTVSTMSFDEQFYLNANQDVLTAVLNGVFSSAKQHFDLVGFKELRDPNANFDTSYYLTQNPDVLSAGVNPFDHFVSRGVSENRAPTQSLAIAGSGGFDETVYRTNNTDVNVAITAGTFTSGYQHWILIGQYEGRPSAQTTGGTSLTSLGASSVGGANAGSSFALTSGTDTFTGGTGNDTFTADLINESGVANVTTLNSTDTLDGSGGTDSLTVTYDDAVSATISNIETLTLSDRAGVTFDFVNVTGVNTLNVRASTAAVDLNNIAAIPTLVAISNQSQNVDIDFAAAAVTGSTDTLTMSVASMTAGNIVVDTGIEIVSLTSSGASANIIADLQTTTGASTLTLSGSQALTITASLDDAVTTINAATATAGVTITQDVAANITFTGGSGNDVIDLGADNFDASDTVNGGDGTDKLAIEEDDAIAITTAGAALTNVSNIETVDLVDQLAGNVTLTLFGASASAAPTTLELSAGIDAADRTLTVASGNTIDLEADAGDDISIVVAGAGTSDVVNLILDNADVAANIQAGSVETLNITSTGTADGGANVITGTTAINALAGTQSIVITGAEALTFTGVVTADAIYGALMTDVLTISAGTTASAVITGGSANDSLNVGDGNADVVVGGAGVDTITFDIEAADNLTGGLGNDVFTMDNDTDVTFAGAVITDLSANDDLNLDESTLETNTLGGAAIAELTDFAGVDITGAQDLTFVTVGADNTALTTGDIAVITGKTYGSVTDVLADILTGGARTFTAAANYTDEDGILIAYELTTGGVELALFAHNGGGNASSNSMDAADVIVTLSGLTATTVQTMDFNLVG